MIENFYPTLLHIASQPPDKRYLLLKDLHTEALNLYIQAVSKITPEQAGQIAPGGRSLAQVAGHIGEWDRASLAAMGEIYAGIKNPGIMSDWNTNEDGDIQHFKDVDDFNAYYARQQAIQPWEQIQSLAIEMANRFYRLVAGSGLITPGLLEGTRLFDYYRLPTGDRIVTPCGWYLWMITIEHEVMEHRVEMGILADKETGQAANSK